MSHKGLSSGRPIVNKGMISGKPDTCCLPCKNLSCLVLSWHCWWKNKTKIKMEIMLGLKYKCCKVTSLSPNQRKATEKEGRLSRLNNTNKEDVTLKQLSSHSQQCLTLVVHLSSFFPDPTVSGGLGVLCQPVQKSKWNKTIRTIKLQKLPLESWNLQVMLHFLASSSLVSK